MARIRTTIDVWELYGCYGHGMEYLISEYSRKEINRRLKEYRENEHGVYIIKKTRKRIA